MNMTRFLLDCFDYAIFLPAAVLCILPVLRHSRIRLNILLPVTFSGLILLTLLMAFTRSALNIDPNIPLLIALLPSFLCYLAAFDVSRLKLWYIFISSVAVFSFGGLSTHYVEAMLDSESEELISCSIKWGVSLLFLAAEALFLKKLRWLLDNDYVNVIWKFVWLVPAMITVFNFIMIPVDYENVRVGRIFQMYLMYQFTLVTFFIFFLIMQYGIARAITVKTEAERNSQILGTQAAQYEKLKKYMDSTARLRHDFFFLAKTAQSLAAEGENEQLRQLLNDYCAELDANAAPVNYCENTALNALTSYYAEEARRQDISFTARLNVAQDISCSDYELCSIVGNILDNAIAAAANVRNRQPAIRFVADTKPNGDLYLAVSNSKKTANGSFETVRCFCLHEYLSVQTPFDFLFPAKSDRRAVAADFDSRKDNSSPKS